MPSADLLAFSVSASEVADRNLINVLGARNQACKHLGVLFPPCRLQFVRIQQLTSVKKVAAIDVGEGRVVEDVERERDQSISDPVPEVVHTGHFRRGEATAHHHIGITLEDRTK